MLHSPLAIAGMAMVVIICGYALLTGTRREQIGGFVYLLAYVATYLMTLVTTHDNTALRYMAPDVVCLITFLYLSWKAPHPWPLWALAAQFLTVAAEVATLTHSLTRWTLLTAEAVAGYGVLLALLIGTLAANRVRREQRKGKA